MLKKLKDLTSLLMVYHKYSYEYPAMIYTVFFWIKDICTYVIYDTINVHVYMCHVSKFSLSRGIDEW